MVMLREWIQLDIQKLNRIYGMNFLEVKIIIPKNHRCLSDTNKLLDTKQNIQNNSNEGGLSFFNKKI